MLLLIIPLGFFADRLCFIDIVDPAYHALLWAHERLPLLFGIIGIISAGAALTRFVRIQQQISALEELRSAPPPEIAKTFVHASKSARLSSLDLIYIDVPTPFCFAVFGDRVMVSRGFLDLLSSDEVVLVALHEAAHIRSRDALKALLWHLFFAALIAPGFEPLEMALYQRREHNVDMNSRVADPAAYDALLARFNNSMCRGTPAAAFRIESLHRNNAWKSLIPATVPVTLLILLAVSQVVFVENLAYLQSHHC